MRTDGRAPVIGDVARAAGVSRQTVSRVVNDHPHVRAATRDQVQRVIDQLGYRPNSAAQRLAGGRMAALGLVCRADGPRAGGDTVAAVLRAARHAGFVVMMVQVDDCSPGALLAAVDELAARGAEGVLTTTGCDVSTAREAWSRLPVESCDALDLDEVEAAGAVVGHLVSLGHRRIEHVAGPMDWPQARARHRGWRRALASAGLPVASVIEGDWSSASGYAAGCRLLRAREVPRAVFAGSDEMAVGVLRAFEESGFRVPDDISLVGFGGVPDMEYLNPPLTTVQVPDRGFQAMSLLLARVNGADPPNPGTSAGWRLVLRASTAVPRIERGRHELEQDVTV